MATTTLSQIPQKITVPADTNEHDIDFDNMLTSLGFQVGYALLSDFSGTVQINGNNVSITSASGTFGTSSHPMIPIKKGVKIRYKGGSGSETFNITIVRP